MSDTNSNAGYVLSLVIHEMHDLTRSDTEAAKHCIHPWDCLSTAHSQTTHKQQKTRTDSYRKHAVATLVRNYLSNTTKLCQLHKLRTLTPTPLFYELPPTVPLRASQQSTTMPSARLRSFGSGSGGSRRWKGRRRVAASGCEGRGH